MSGAEPTVEEVAAALKQSGYLMEQEIASRLEAMGFTTRTNFPYVDPDEKKSREMDVAAFHQFFRDEEKKIAASVELIIECKQSSSPFAFISRNKIKSDYTAIPQEFAFSKERYPVTFEKDGQSFVRLEEPFHYLGFDKMHYAYDNPEKAVQFCRVDRNGKGWRANHSGLYDSIFLPLTKALGFRRSKLPIQKNTGGWQYLWVFIPMVIVKGTLYKVQSHIDPDKTDAVDHVTFTRDIYVGDAMKRYSVEFIRDSFLEDFITEVVNPFIQKVNLFLTESPERFLGKDVGPKGK